MESCINQQHAWSGIRIKMVAKVFKSGRIYNWINYSWLTVSFSTVCLTGPAVRVFLVSRNRCVPGRLLNSVLGAEAWQLWQCCRKYQPTLLSPPQIPVHCAALLVSVCIGLTHRKSLMNWESFAWLCNLPYIFSRTYSRPGTLIIHAFRKRSQSVCCHSFKTGLFLTHIAAFFTERENTAVASSAAKNELEKTLLHFTSFPLPSVFLCRHSLTVTLAAPLWRTPQSYPWTLQESQGKLQPPFTTASKQEARL